MARTKTGAAKNTNGKRGDAKAGTNGDPFEDGEHGQIAVKVIDDRGNELLVVKGLS